MSAEKQIEESIQKLAGTYLKDLVQIILCKVDSVVKENSVCDCTPIGGDAATSLPGVLLSAENNNGLVVFPVVGSTVIVALSTKNTAFVMMYSEVESIQFMDGSFGGVPKLLDPDDSEAGVLKRLNNIEQNQNLILSALKGITVTIPSGGGSVPFNPFFSTINSLSETTKSQLENTLITQGKN